jgi:hypothetical protein
VLGKLDNVMVSREPLIGWRGWDIIDGRFTSPDQGTVWGEDGTLQWNGSCGCFVADARIVKAMMTALAESGKPASEQDALNALRSEEPCHCGINSFATRERLEAAHYASDCDAVGEVELTGEVRTFEDGYRAERAQIVRVWATRWRHAHEVRWAAKDAGIEYAGVLSRGWRAPLAEALSTAIPAACAATMLLPAWFALVASWALFVASILVMGALSEENRHANRALDYVLPLMLCCGSFMMLAFGRIAVPLIEAIVNATR